MRGNKIFPSRTRHGGSRDAFSASVTVTIVCSCSTTSRTPACSSWPPTVFSPSSLSAATMASRSLPLRILYTINSSPQYILARSHKAYPVELIHLEHGHTNHAYASASLKDCLHTICRSSPELIQDNSRDFSVYVLDPLESGSAPAPVQISNPNSRSPEVPPEAIRGVAVGFGLMTWALRSDDDLVRAVGTIVRTGGGSESLEVVFALREVRSHPT